MDAHILLSPVGQKTETRFNCLLTENRKSTEMMIEARCYQNDSWSARRVIGATAKPLYPIDGKAEGLDRRTPQTNLFERGGTAAAVEGVSASRARRHSALSRRFLYNPGCRVETLLVSKGVMGFLGDLRGRNSKSPPNPLGLRSTSPHSPQAMQSSLKRTSYASYASYARHISGI